MYNMKKDNEERIRGMEEFRRKCLTEKSKAREFLKRAGIIDEHGKLTETYGGSKKNEEDKDA